jgi:acyl-CoA thioesterase-2
MAERYGERLGTFFQLPRPIDLRYVGTPPWLAGESGTRDARQQVWMRADGKLPDDPLVHVCALTYASDITLLNTVLLGHAMTWDGVVAASLDHAMWFHRPFRADEWFLYDSDSPTASGARGFAQGRIFTADGRYAVTVVQEGLLRLRR